VLGRADLVARLRRHPLARALRVDKLTVAALEATLRGPQPPAHAALARTEDELRQRAERMADELRPAGIDATVVGSTGVVGGGGAPELELPGWAVALPERFAEALRAGDPCVVGRVENRRCLLDLRCVPPERDADVTKAVLAV
jgi:L-seryl-tRNA(Ser) seleniumtransferase